MKCPARVRAPRLESQLFRRHRFHLLSCMRLSALAVARFTPWGESPTVTSSIRTPDFGSCSLPVAQVGRESSAGCYTRPHGKSGQNTRDFARAAPGGEGDIAWVVRGSTSTIRASRGAGFSCPPRLWAAEAAARSYTASWAWRPAPADV